ncbi:MAG TPA: hypothetical protein VKP11_08685 [Frankiaceae bacterium]|nr:hypothetical protein [Frankiaceae bacterium]
MAGAAHHGWTGRTAALGEAVRIGGYGLAGALLLPADTPVEVRRAWQELPDDVCFVLLTPAAATALGQAVDPGGAPTVGADLPCPGPGAGRRDLPLVAVMPP